MAETIADVLLARGDAPMIDWLTVAWTLPGQVLAIALLLVGSWRGARVLIPSPMSERALAAAVLFFSSAIAIIGTLGIFGILFAMPLLLTCCLVGGVGIVSESRLARTIVVAEPWSMPTGSLGLAPWVLAGCLAISYFVRGLVHVPLEWDSLSYHLLKPALWLHDAKLSIFHAPFPQSQYAYFPASGEMIWALLMGVMHNDLLVCVLNLPFIALLGVAMYRIALVLGATRRSAALAALPVLTMPAVLGFAASSDVESILHLAELAAIIFALRWLDSAEEGEWKAPLLCGLSAGIAVGTKYIALPTMGLLMAGIPFAAIWLTRSLRKAITPTAAAWIGFLVVGTLWYVLDFRLTGSPVYPVPLGTLPAARWERYDWSFTIVSHLAELIRSGSFPACWVLPRAETGIGRALGWAGVIYFPAALAGLLLLVVSSVRQVRAANAGGALHSIVLATMTAVALGSYFRVPYFDESWLLGVQTRFMVPFLALGIASFAGMLDRLRENVLSALVVALMLVNAVQLDLSIPGLDMNSSRVALGVLAVLLIAALRGVRRPLSFKPRFPHFAVAAVALVLGLALLLVYREANRYSQYVRLSEVERGYQASYAPAAVVANGEFQGKRVAFATNNAAFLYLFVGPFFEQRPVYVDTYDGPKGTFLFPDGNPRHTLDRDAWQRNLRASGAAGLVVARLSPIETRPPESDWAQTLGFKTIYSDEYAEVFDLSQLTAKASTSPLPPSPTGR